MDNVQSPKADEIAAEKARLEVEKLRYETRPGWFSRNFRQYQLGISFFQICISLFVPISIFWLTVQQKRLESERVQTEKQQQALKESFDVKIKMYELLQRQNEPNDTIEQMQLLWLIGEVPDTLTQERLLHSIYELSKYPTIRMKAKSQLGFIQRRDSVILYSEQEQVNKPKEVLLSELQAQKEEENPKNTQTSTSTISADSVRLIEKNNLVYYIDIFWLEGTPDNVARCAAARQALIKYGFLSNRVSVKRLPRLINLRPNYSVFKNEIRYDIGEASVATDIHKSLMNSKDSLNTTKVPVLTQLNRKREAKYVSVFFVE